MQHKPLSTWSRRELVRAGASALLTSTWAASAKPATRPLTVCSYGGIFEQHYRRAVIEPFMRANPHIAVHYYGVMTSAQMLGMLRAQRARPQIDVCLLDIISAKVATDEELVARLDDELLSVGGQLHPRAIVPGVAGLAATFVHLALLYSPTAFRHAPSSWRVLWDEAESGRIVIQKPPHAIGVAFTLLAAFLEGATRPIQYRLGIDSIERMARGVLNWDPKPDPYAFIVHGAAALGVGWSARGQVYASQSPNQIAVARPREGTIAYMDMITRVENSPRPDDAQRFIAYALSGEAQGSFAERMYYTPTRKGTKLTANAAARTATPAEIEGMLPVNWLEVAQIRDRLSQQWRREILLRD